MASATWPPRSMAPWPDRCAADGRRNASAAVQPFLRRDLIFGVRHRRGLSANVWRTHRRTPHRAERARHLHRCGTDVHRGDRSFATAGGSRVCSSSTSSSASLRLRVERCYRCRSAGLAVDDGCRGGPFAIYTLMCTMIAESPRAIAVGAATLLQSARK
jgi:hypothetical protein